MEIDSDLLFDREKEDIGNIISFEHINVNIPDQRTATLFYVSGLGLTRDPYLVTSISNMWINIGRNQFHLPTGKPLMVRGTIGLVIPNRKALLNRLTAVNTELTKTKFSFVNKKSHVLVTCPWGNLFRIHTPSKRFGKTALGIAYIEFDAPKNTAVGIGTFYRDILGAKTRFNRSPQPTARIQVGNCQELIFRETQKQLRSFDGHHIQLYVADFSGPYKKLLERGLISEESNQYQYRFENIVCPSKNEILFKLDHEIRSLTHPLYARPLVNRNAEQTNSNFAAGHENLSWSLPIHER